MTMTQADLNRAVAQATGETITTIRELGFGLADPEVVRHDPEPHHLGVEVLDWDELDAQRHVPLFPRRCDREAAVA
jgi:hypothetical protein